MIVRRLLALGALLLAPLCVRGQAAPATPAPGAGLTVTLVTFGQAEEVFERFGHNALWFQNGLTGEDVAYHWGLFSFEQPHFVARFLTGDTRYWMGTGDVRPEELIEFWRRNGRPITLQRLNLTPGQATKLHDFVVWNARPENKFYRYDYFQDNCSTRLRDALDLAVGGAIKAATDTAITALSFRRESVRLVDGDKPVQLGIDIALGRPADAPLTKWKSFFIPMRLRDAIRTIRITGADGSLVPLVSAERVIDPLPPPPPLVELQTAPRLAVRYGLLGLLLAAMVCGLRVMMVSRRGAAWGLAVFGAIWSFLSGVIGVIVLLAWFLTRHVFWAANENVLLLTPFSLALAILIPAAVLGSRARSAARLVSAVVAACALAGFLLAVIPGGEENRAVVALFLPVHLSFAWALWSLDRARA